MKELSIEEKAKRYDEALERMKDFLKVWEDCGAVGEAMKKTQNIFPELKDSEDERVKEELKEVLGECLNVRPQIVEEKQYMRLIAWLEKQGEQKTVDEIAKEVCKNKELATAFLKSAGIMNEKGELAEQYRQSEQKSYASKTMNKKGDFDNGFTRMTEKKQTATWSEKDKEMSRFIGNAITADDSSVYLKSKGIEVIDVHVWLDELKDRVQPQQKQEWGKDDERCLVYAIDACETASDDYDNSQSYIDAIKWLKSLKPQNRWKPSERQKEALLWCVVHLGGADKQTLGELLEELNKL